MVYNCNCSSETLLNFFDVLCSLDAGPKVERSIELELGLRHASFLRTEFLKFIPSFVGTDEFYLKKILCPSTDF